MHGDVRTNQSWNRLASGPRWFRGRLTRWWRLGFNWMGGIDEEDIGIWQLSPVGVDRVDW